MENISEIIFYVSGSIMLLLLLIFSAIISGSEAALFSLSAKQLEGCTESKDPKKKLILKILDKGKHLLATIIIISNFVNIGFVILGNYILWKFFGKDGVSNIIMISYTVMSAALLILFGELIPKMYSTYHNLFISKHMSGIINFFMIILKPFSIPLIKIGEIFGKSSTPEKYNLSSEELDRALKLTVIGDNSEEEEILKGIASFGGLYARQIKTPRTEITAINVNSKFSVLMSLITKSGYSRLPVFEENLDKIKGIIYTKDLIHHIDESNDFEWKSLLRDVFFIPETKRLDSLLLDFKEKRIHIAIVVDEYGGTSGLVTMEDLIEKIIGSVVDENIAKNVLNSKKSEKNTCYYEGKVFLDEFCKSLNIPLSFFEEVKGESESLAGLILEINGSLPNVGKEIIYKNLKFNIVSTDNKRIIKVKVQVNQT